MNIGTRIKEFCEKKNISVAQIEKMAGIPAKSISKWDKNIPSFDKVQRVLDALEISYEEFMDIGLPETQKIQTALVKIRMASPEVYNDIMRKWLTPDNEDKKILVTESDELSNVILNATDKQKELIQEVLRLPEQQVSAFLSLAKSLPGNQGVQDDSK